MPIERVALLGAGGHAKVVYDAVMSARLAERVEVWDDDAKLSGAPFLDLRVRAPIRLEDLPECVHLAIGDNRARSVLFARLAGRKALSLMHPTAAASVHAQIARGAFVAAGAVVAAAAKIGECAIINHRAVVDHDCIVGAFAHVAPSATLGGAVRVGEGALIGSGAVVLPGISIGAWAIVGAGAVVNHPVSDGETVYGVPARGKGQCLT